MYIHYLNMILFFLIQELENISTAQSNNDLTFLYISGRDENVTRLKQFIATLPGLL